ncbi:lysoplasmalogenase [Rhodocaloribacter sp.]
MLVPILSALILLSAAIHIRAEYAGPKVRVYVFKPLTTALILLLAATAATETPAYRNAVLAGLAFSLLGDVFLMLPKDRFLHGLAAFLVAHVWYVAAFTTGTGFHTDVLPLLPYLAGGFVLMYVLRPHLGRMRGPVLVYGVVIVVMGWQAAARWEALGGTGPLLAALGATLFIVSDATLAVNRFARPFPAAQALILSTYYAAQGLIALSV